MNQYYQLIKDQIITFDKLILDKYSLIGLNETEVIILLKLNESLKNGKKVLLIKDIIPNTSLDELTLSKIFVDLVNRGYINIELSDIDASESYNLDGTYQRLSEVFEGVSPNKVVLSANVSKAVQLLELKLGKQLSPLDFEIIQKWFADYQYRFEEFEEAVYQSEKNKKVNVKYIDRILYNKRQSKTSDDSAVNKEIKSIFDRCYGKK